MNKGIVLGAGLLLLAVAGSAQAQETKEKRWRVSLGVGFPTDATGKSFLGKSPLSTGASYDLGRTAGGVWGLYSDSLIRSRETGTTTNTQGVTGFGVQLRMRSAGDANLYYGAGVGMVNVSRSSAVETGDTTVTTTTQRDVFGGRVFVGKDFGRYFGEAGYSFVGRARLGGSSVNGSGPSLRAGIRF